MWFFLEFIEEKVIEDSYISFFKVGIYLSYLRLTVVASFYVCNVYKGEID